MRSISAFTASSPGVLLCAVLSVSALAARNRLTTHSLAGLFRYCLLRYCVFARNTRVIHFVSSRVWLSTLLAIWVRFWTRCHACHTSRKLAAATECGEHLITLAARVRRYTYR